MSFPHNCGDFFKKPMLHTSFSLIHKKQLTHDVFELIYRCEDLSKSLPLPGQYVMFQLAPGLNRAYSLSDFDTQESTFTLIVKRITDGKWSPIICDATVWDEFKGMIPLGHFTLKTTKNNKCFIGTGTGFAPLYLQCKTTITENLSPKIAFIFGVRSHEDSFYWQEIQELQAWQKDFKYIPYFSREPNLTPNENQGYVTDWITNENIAPYQEFYICGSPAMVKNAREKLEKLGIKKDQIFWEQY